MTAETLNFTMMHAIMNVFEPNAAKVDNFLPNPDWLDSKFMEPVSPGQVRIGTSYSRISHHPALFHNAAGQGS